MARPGREVGRRSRRTPPQIPFYLERAYRIADAGRKGAVHLTIPVDVFTGGRRRRPRGVPRAGSAEPAVLRTSTRAIDLLRAAERPVVIAG